MRLKGQPHPADDMDAPWCTQALWLEEGSGTMFRRLKTLVAASAVCLGLATSSTSFAHAFEPRVPETFFGVSATELWNETVLNRDAARDAQLNGMKAIGADWVRVEIGWPEVEPVAPLSGVHTYNWSAADRLVAALAQRNMELLAVPGATPSWAAGVDGAAASCGRRSEVAAGRAADYGSFVGAVARRYGPTGTFWASRPDLPKIPVRRWELWNEPNWNGFWCPKPDPEIFATLVKRAADSVHGIDPDAQVILGGLAALQDSRHEGDRLKGMAADEFLERAVEREPGLTQAIDAVGFHPYDIDPDVDLAMVGWLRRHLDDQGFGNAEIVLSEFGWRRGTGLGALTELLRAANYTNLVGRLPRTDCGISAVAAYAWQTKELDLLNPDHWWGISSPLTGLLHPSGQAYRDQVALYEGRGPTPAPRSVIEICGAAEPPDSDEDGTPDEEDDYPIDPDRDRGSGEDPPPPPEEDPVEPRTREPRKSDSFFGATIVQLPDDFTRLGDDFEAMASVRIASARFRVDWSWIEPVAPTDPTYTQRARWNWMDRVILKMGAEGIRPTPAFGSIPGWAPSSGTSFDSAFSAFVSRFAERYGREGTFWSENRNLDEEQLAVRDFEVWQYGNLTAHAADGVATPADYAATYSAVRATVKGIDPGARAVASLGELGVGGRAGAFLREMQAARPTLSGSVDAVHVWAEHSRTSASVDVVMRDTRRGLEAAGNAQSPMLLSFGAPTAGAGAMTENERAAFFEQVVSRAARSDCGVGGIFAHAWTTPESNPNEPYEWMGIADPDDSSLSGTAIAYRDTASSFLGYGSVAAPSDAVHPCDALPPDTDGDGTRDPADPAPLDPTISTPTQAPPLAPTISGGPSSPTNSRSASFTLTAAGAASFQCKLDSGVFESCQSNPTFSNLAHGAHTLRVRAVDGLGLVGAESVKTWTVDVVGPSVVNVSGPIPISLDSRVTFSFSTDDPGSQVACQLDGHPWENCASPKVYSFIGDGAHDFRTRAVDVVGNVGQIRLTQFAVRTQPGGASITSGPASGEVTGSLPEFGFSSDFAASYECRFEAESWAPCSDATRHVPAAPLEQGIHAFEVRGVGGTGKLGMSASRTFEVDATPPKVSINLEKATRKAARFTLAVVDSSGVSDLECSLDSGNFKTCGSPHVVKKLKRGRHELSVRATDTVGNTGQGSKRWSVRGR